MQVFEADGLQVILSLLPVPYNDASADSSAATAAGPPTWAGRPQSAQLQANLLQLFAALLQSAQVRGTLITNDSAPNSTPSSAPSSVPSSTSCLPVLLNLLQPNAPQLPAAPQAAAVLAGGKRPTSGKPDGKGKAAGKGPAAPAGPVVPPPELMPPFPAVVQLAAVQCLQVSILPIDVCFALSAHYWVQRLLGLLCCY